eukprot:5994996-Prymnesium_polylepis.1
MEHARSSSRRSSPSADRATAHGPRRAPRSQPLLRCTWWGCTAKNDFSEEKEARVAQRWPSASGPARDAR